MPRCPETCPKVIQQRKAIAAAQAARDRENRAASYTTSEYNPDEEEQNVEDLSITSSKSYASDGTSLRSITSTPRTLGRPGHKGQSGYLGQPGHSGQYSNKSLQGASAIVLPEGGTSGRNTGSAIIIGKYGQRTPLTPQRQKELQSELEQKQQEVDNYYLNQGGLNYFEDFCNCSLECVLRHLAKDKFVRNTLASLFFFGLGIKLCNELDSWTVPRTFG